MPDDDPKFVNWLQEKGLKAGEYYLVVGRFVPENNYETMIREYLRSHSKKDFALITNVNEKFLEELEKKLGWRSDPRIKFVGTVYDKELLKKIRENAYGYFHGHEVGGTNPRQLLKPANMLIRLLIAAVRILMLGIFGIMIVCSLALIIREPNGSSAMKSILRTREWKLFISPTHRVRAVRRLERQFF